MLFKINRLILPMAVAAICSCSGNSGDKNSSRVVHNVFLVQPEAAGDSSSKSFAAVVQEARTISTGFKTAGQIENILVKEGDYVERGQLLAVLDTVDYALGVSQLRVQHKQMMDEFERRKKIYAAGSMSENDYEKSIAGMEQLSLQLALNENKLRYCRLYAPVSGYIIKRSFEPAEMVDAGTPVFELMDNSHLEVVVDLPVSEYIHRGDFMSFTGRSSLRPGMSFPLNMLSLTPRADNNQLYQLKLTLSPGSAVNLTPGMNLTVDIVTAGSGSKAVEVPIRSVFERDGRSFVWAFEPSDSTVHATEVVASGQCNGAKLLIISGLEVSDRIVRAGVHHLVDGEKVNVIEAASETNVGNLL